MPRLVTGADRIQGLVPGGQELAGGRIEVTARRLLPHGQVVAVEPDGGGGWPPDLVVGGSEHLAQAGARDGAADGQVHVRCQSALGFDGSEVLDIEPGKAAQILDEAVEQRREMQRVPGRALVAVAVRVDRSAVLAYRPITWGRSA